MEVEYRDILELEVDGKGRVLIPVEKRREHGIEEGDKIEIAVLGKNREGS